MSPALPTVTARQLTRALERAGFAFSRQRGSHQIYRHVETGKRVSVPVHTGDVPKGTCVRSWPPVCCRPFGASLIFGVPFPGADAPGFMLSPPRGLGYPGSSILDGIRARRRRSPKWLVTPTRPTRTMP
ncbi:MAG TPA: type II toxin-antitoxin system HicA family toxin [Thermoanaerobaculia bacterium]|nr:type II toxin-antitoxin system HicA family toxin [Thermoanaerobaculia bacterium]